MFQFVRLGNEFIVTCLCFVDIEIMQLLQNPQSRYIVNLYQNIYFEMLFINYSFFEINNLFDNLSY